MPRHTRILLPVVLLLLMVRLAPSAPPMLPPSIPQMEPPVPPVIREKWEQTALKNKVTDAEIKLLREQKFLVTGDSLRQVFTPYVGSRVPVFITSDSILNAYHVLLEESIYRMELANSRKLPGVLETIAKKLDTSAAKLKGDDALVKAAKKRAAIFLGVARNLLDEKALPADADVKATVQDEVKRIVAANGVSKPAWLGPSDDGFLAIDYSRFKPRGFYTRSPALQRYFRAIAWLQAIPFRLERDEEFVAIAMMHGAYFEREEKIDQDGSLWPSFRAFLGERDDWDLTRVRRVPAELTGAALEEARKYYRPDEKDRSQINDQLRFIPPEPGAKPELAFRFLSAYRLPDAVMFHRTMAPGGMKRNFPSGLEVAAALGAPFARDTLKKDSPKLLREIDATRPLFKCDNLYADYLQCLGTLVKRTEPDAPKFMRDEPWRIKTTQTALAGWAQMRHTWVLQAKMDIMWMSASPLEPGFVEPVPEFYGLLAKLIDHTSNTLERAGAFTDSAKEMLAERTHELRAAQDLVRKAIEKKADLSSFTPEERSLLAKFDPRLEDKWDWPEEKRDSPRVLRELQDGLDALARTVELEIDIARLRGRKIESVETNWKRLSSLCHRLEVLAHKQLRQVPFSKDEDTFIENYGEELAAVMFYDGNSYKTPLDDAMRVVDVYSNPNVGGHLHVGIARPRIMWVLYPTKNGEVLCRGAIVPYAEFINNGRLTDSEWKSLLDSPKKPDIPTWAKTVIPPERPRAKVEN